MKRAHSVIVGARSGPAGHAGAWIIGLAVVWMASLPSPAWGQWSGGPTGPIYYGGGNVGIGTNAPQGTLDIYGLGLPSGPFAVFYLRDAGSALRFIPFGGTNYIESGSTLSSDSRADLRFTSMNGGATFMTIQGLTGNVGIGTTNPQHLLHVAGTIGAEEVLVTSTGADYVFDPGYRLRPLSEVASYIQANHHLPDIPSANEVKQKGMGVGEMEAKLLAKIEELTLHMIQADERNNRLEKQNQELRNRIARVEAQSAR